MGNGTYFKQVRHPHGLTEDQLVKAYTLYEEKITGDIFKELEDEQGLDHGNDEMKTYLKMYISKGLLKGMELALDSSLVTDHYKEVKKIKTDTRCGVLDVTDGEFYGCAVGGHWETIDYILLTKYQDIYGAFVEMTRIDSSKDSHEGTTREWLDNFILTSFQLLGGSMVLREYL